MDKIKIKRALISVSDKTGITEFAQALANNSIEILSTGGTYKLLKENNIVVTEVSDYTNFPEIMDGRLKTLHPKIHGGILARRNIDTDIADLHGIDYIDLVVVNLYPFAQAIVSENITLTEVIENIDIGGPTMIRSAAKNHKDVAVVVDKNDYSFIINAIKNGGLTAKDRFKLALRAFEHTALYDGMITNFLTTLNFDASISSNMPIKHVFPSVFNAQFHLKTPLRYGENPHQRAAFYVDERFQGTSVATSTQIQGKELSYNNIADSDAAFECVRQFENPACVIVKHANPCGVATITTNEHLSLSYTKAYDTDPESAFGGIIAFNRKLDAETTETIINKQFVEVIIAPHISDGARIVLQKKSNIRVLEIGNITPTSHTYDYKKINGGLLIQDLDNAMVTLGDLKVVTTLIPEHNQLQDLLFAWNVCKFVKSNAIVFAQNKQTIGIGAGQMSRVNSTRIAAIKAKQAGFNIVGSVMASDAFFPFRDSIDKAHELGITAIIQPGGSMRDLEVIEAANNAGIAMVFTGIRHFRH